MDRKVMWKLQGLCNGEVRTMQQCKLPTFPFSFQDQVKLNSALTSSLKNPTIPTGEAIGSIQQIQSQLIDTTKLNYQSKFFRHPAIASCVAPSIYISTWIVPTLTMAEGLSPLLYVGLLSALKSQNNINNQFFPMSIWQNWKKQLLANTMIIGDVAPRNIFGHSAVPRGNGG